MESLTHLLPSSGDVSLAWTKVTEPYSPEILDESELSERDSFESITRRREYLATRGLIREMLRQKNWDPEFFELRKDELGKPYARYDGAAVHLSIAHTVHYVLCGMSESQPIGIDLEPTDRTVPEQLRDRIINRQERSLLAEEPGIRVWTIKEALVKLQGTGMRTNLNDCTILSLDSGRCEAKFYNDKRAKICSFRYQKNWFAVARNC